MDENTILQTNNTLLYFEDINLQYSISFVIIDLQMKTEPFYPVKLNILICSMLCKHKSASHRVSYTTVSLKLVRYGQGHFSRVAAS